MRVCTLHTSIRVYINVYIYVYIYEYKFRGKEKNKEPRDRAEDAGEEGTTRRDVYIAWLYYSCVSVARRQWRVHTKGAPPAASDIEHKRPEGCQQVARPAEARRTLPTGPPPFAVLIVERRPQSTRTGVRGVTHCT